MSPLTQTPTDGEPRMYALDLARLRAAVALLGGASGAGWWPGRSLDAVGQAVLARLFATAPLLAALGAATESVSRAHDERIGRSGVYHAFRLPTAMEADLTSALADHPDVLAYVVRDADAAHQTLHTLADGTPGDALDGPQSIGDETTIAHPDALKRLAALYLAALGAGKPVYPYVVAAAPSA